MNVKTHEYYNCVEGYENQLLVDQYSDRVYFEVMTDEDGGVFLDHEKVELLISQLKKWLEDTI